MNYLEERILINRFREPEVSQLDYLWLITAKQDVFWFKIPMGDLLIVNILQDNQQMVNRQCKLERTPKASTICAVQILACGSGTGPLLII